MRLFRPGLLAKFFYPEALFRLKRNKKELILTFDDGPDPGSTMSVLEILEKYKIKALFFCSGIKAEKYPEIIDQLTTSGHIIGNHGYRHLDGFKSSPGDYLENVDRASEFTSSFIYRPPYGRMRRSQYRELIKTYKIVLWDLMPYDFDKKFGGDRSLNVLMKKIRPGSVIVLHDTADSSQLSFLDEFIGYAHGKGYKFTTILPSGKK